MRWPRSCANGSRSDPPRRFGSPRRLASWRRPVTRQLSAASVPRGRLLMIVVARILLVPYAIWILLLTLLPPEEAGRVTGIVAVIARVAASWGAPLRRRLRRPGVLRQHRPVRSVGGAAGAGLAAGVCGGAHRGGRRVERGDRARAARHPGALLYALRRHREHARDRDRRTGDPHPRPSSQARGRWWASLSPQRSGRHDCAPTGYPRTASGRVIGRGFRAGPRTAKAGTAECDPGPSVAPATRADASSGR